jgi:hypothetical protein
MAVANGLVREVRDARTAGSVSMTVSSMIGVGGTVTTSEGILSTRAAEVVGEFDMSLMCSDM